MAEWSLRCEHEKGASEQELRTLIPEKLSLIPWGATAQGAGSLDPAPDPCYMNPV